MIFTGASNIIDIQVRRFEEVNQWGQIIPLQNFAALDLYTKCIDAIDTHFQYPSFFSGLIMYYTILTTDHWTHAQKSSLKDPQLIKSLQTQAEDIILLGWNSRNNDPTVGVGQLNTLVQTLHAMDKSMNCRVEDIMNPSSAVCSVLENQWIKSSFCRFQSNARTHQISSDIIKYLISFSNGNYEALHNFMTVSVPFFKKRWDTHLSSYGNYQLSLENVQTLVMIYGLKGPAFEKLKDNLAWLTGSNNPELSYDQFGVGNASTHSSYDVFASTGVFVKVKGEQLRFKEVYETLITVMRNEDVSHLFLMAVLFNSDETKHLQNQYQFLLVKKLAEFKNILGAENGDQALCSLKSLFTEYVTLSGRFLSSLKNQL